MNGQQDVFEMIRFGVQEEVGRYLTGVMNAELTHFLGREPYERKEEEANYRNGFYGRSFTVKGIGEVLAKVPRDRKGDYQTRVIPRFQRYEKEVGRDLCLMFLAGVSTRSLSMLSERLVGQRLSHSEISSANKELKEGVEKWRNRDLSKERIKYLIVDGVRFDMRVKGSIEKVSVLVVIGVTEMNQRLVLALQAGNKESAPTWRGLFKDIKSRGLDPEGVSLGIMDKALAFFSQFTDTWSQALPSAVKCLQSSIEACLTFLNFPQEEWISLRTTNIIERLNKEFKRRTKPMEILVPITSGLHSPDLYCSEDGASLEVKPFRKSRQDPSCLVQTGEK